VFWPIFIALILFGIICYIFGSTRKSPAAKATLFAFSGVFFIITGALVQAEGLMIDWPTTMNQAAVDTNTVTTISYTTLSSSEGTEPWVLSWGLMGLGIVSILSGLVILMRLFGGDSRGEEF